MVFHSLYIFTNQHFVARCMHTIHLTMHWTGLALTLKLYEWSISGEERSHKKTILLVPMKSSPVQPNPSNKEPSTPRRHDCTFLIRRKRASPKITFSASLNSRFFHKVDEKRRNFVTFLNQVLFSSKLLFLQSPPLKPSSHIQWCFIRPEIGISRITLAIHAKVRHIISWFGYNMSKIINYNSTRTHRLTFIFIFL